VYLTGVEKRLHSLETLVSQLVPGVDVDDLLSSPNLPQLAGTTPPAINPITPKAVLSPQAGVRSDLRESALPEAVPINADGFNWQEENVSVDGLTDGMAALSVEPTGVGYLG
jgi:transcriptional regulatory protein GAL4